MKPFFSRAVSHVTPIITYGQRHLSARLTGSEAGAQSWLCWAEAWAVQCQGQTLPCSSVLSYGQAGPVPARGHRHGQCIPNQHLPPCAVLRASLISSWRGKLGKEEVAAVVQRS